MGANIKIQVTIAALATIAAALVIPFFQSLEEKSLRAEVRVILGYMATLQGAYHTDSGQYAYFDEPYGAPINGEENCLRPKGAETLGFTLNNCKKDPLNGGLRYTYSALKDGESYIGRGTSGSDINGKSYVCAGSKTKDLWEIGPDKQTRQVLDCQ